MLALFFHKFLVVVLSLFLMILGGTIFLIPWSTEMRTQLVEGILEGTLLFYGLGVGLFLIGFSYLAYLYTNRKRRYYFLKMDPAHIQVSETIIRDYLQNYWEELFPARDIPYQFQLKKRKMWIRADLPYLPKEEQQILIERIRNDLGDIFQRLLGYPNPVDVVLCFSKKG